ncbi:MAG: class I SAM-dependent methyltransferase [Alphaproteobacteria bacterium]|nr:class I SAM-dependent methyltransferase [Alphaproteobacteria bacterium]
MELRATFDTVADVYDAVRPGYPDALFEDIGRITGLEAGATVLEVGCGSGQATEGLAHRGWKVTALDPGPALIAAAERRLRSRSEVEFITAPFEAWTPPARRFDLIASAQAWHWVPPVAAFANARRALKPGGWLAIFGNCPVGAPPDFLEALERVSITRGVDLTAPPPESWYLPQGPVAGLVEAAGGFSAALQRGYPWTWRHTTRSYVDFLTSRSDVQILPEALREALITDLAEIVEARGGSLDIDYEARLYLSHLE